MSISIPKYQAFSFRNGSCGKCDTINLLEGTYPFLVQNTIDTTEGIFISQDVSLTEYTSYNLEFGYDVSVAGSFVVEVLDVVNIIHTDTITTPLTGTYSIDFTAITSGIHTIKVSTTTMAIIQSDFTFCDFKLREYTNNVSISQRVIDGSIAQTVGLSLSQKVNIGISQTVNI